VHLSRIHIQGKFESFWELNTMRKLKKYDCYVWTEFFEGTLYLQSAPIHKNGMIDPEKSCDVSVSAFTEKELAEYTREVGRVFEEAPCVVLRWIRG